MTMETDTRIEKLNNSNYFSWKIRIQHLLTLKDLENFLEDDPPSSEEPNNGTIALWFKKDKKAQAVIGLSLSNDLLENVRDVSTKKEIWNAIKNVFERHTLLNKLSAR